MTTPHDPEDEPGGEDLPDDVAADVSAEDALWRAIVENYGERPSLEELDGATTSTPEPGPETGPDPARDPGPDPARDPGPDPAKDPGSDLEPPAARLPPSLPDPAVPTLPPDDRPSSHRTTVDPEDHFVPPPPPPLPTPPPARLLAWVGLFGVPMFVMVALVAGLTLPAWVGLVLMAWFVGGFLFLVASMRKGPGTDPDDGARL
jgi:hypothetical protein